jgi:hypothetical protein
MNLHGGSVAALAVRVSPPLAAFCWILRGATAELWCPQDFSTFRKEQKDGSQSRMER